MALESSATSCCYESEQKILIVVVSLFTTTPLPFQSTKIALNNLKMMEQLAIIQLLYVDSAWIKLNSMCNWSRVSTGSPDTTRGAGTPAGTPAFTCRWISGALSEFCMTCANSCAIRCRPLGDCGSYCPFAKAMARPTVKALAWSCWP